MRTDRTPAVDVVVIGRAPVARCLESVLRGAVPGVVPRTYYVAADSDDSNLAVATAYGEVRCLVTEGTPAAPGLLRNLGWRTGRSDYVQFLDAASELEQGWLRAGLRALADDPDLAAVFGWRAEIRGGSTALDRIADLERNPPAGAAAALGPEALIRRSALEEAGGYDPRLRSGEYLELGLRLLLRGWRIRRLESRMTARFTGPRSVWRHVRAGWRDGYGYAALCGLHPRGSGIYWAYCLGIVLRGCLAPACVLAGQTAPVSAWTGWLLSLAGIAAFFSPRLFLVAHFMRRMRCSEQLARAVAWRRTLLVLPECAGMARALPDVFAALLRQRRFKRHLPVNS